MVPAQDLPKHPVFSLPKAPVCALPHLGMVLHGLRSLMRFRQLAGGKTQGSPLVTQSQGYRDTPVISAFCLSPIEWIKGGS